MWLTFQTAVVFAIAAVGTADFLYRDVTFEQDVTRKDTVYKDPIFEITTSSLSICSTRCLMTLTPNCSGFSFNQRSNACRGYESFSGPKTEAGTRLWKNDIRCHSHYNYIPHLDFCWLKIQQYMNWMDSFNYCKADDARLAVVNSVSKRVTVASEVKAGYFWIGGHLVSNKWIWIDNSAVTMDTNFWGPGEPNGGHGQSACVGWNIGSHGKFDDGQCPDESHFICEKP